ncbi:hypothetical protein [Sphingomonas bacterium]|uniref:hypothetical protein n=1 Tax=Sphingomonas bacterium TaxID=1895847 RepID=UPI0026074F51|nr:hypothetical protein [Sphingomonas bacterium]MDB5680105.1 hypothetical protein [Sphingomonas bacterium]
MTAIVLLSLPEDRDRVGKVLSALVGERLDVVWRSVAPDDPHWAAAIAEAREARCVLFCWSDATRSEAAAPFRRLAAEALAAETAVGIELDRGAVPPDLAAMTLYSLAGWRAHRHGLWRAFAGRIFYNDIVSAAKFKAAGKDPPSPAAPAKLLARQAWVAAVGIGAIVGMLALPKAVYNTIPWPRWNEERAWAAIPKGSCPGLAAFIRDWPDGRHGGEAKDLYAARTKKAPAWTPVERIAPFFVSAAHAAPSATEAGARAVALGRADAEARKACQGYVEAAGSRLKGVGVSPGDVTCNAVGGGTVCSVAGNASCRLEELVDSGAESCPIPGRN